MLDGKVAIIVGGAGQLGRASSLLFAREGAKVMVADVKAADAKRVEDEVKAAGGDAASFQIDVTDPEQSKQLADATLKRFGTIDILVYTPYYPHGSDLIEDVSPANWKKSIDVNLNGAVYCSQSVIRTMKQKRSGRIINISAGASVGAPKMAAYSSSKAALVVFTKCIAAELGPYGITANAIVPGSFGPRERFGQAVLDFVKRRYPLGRLGTPEELANGVLFLASPMADYITAVALPIDGGFTGVLRAYNFGEEPA
ncbi:MAG: SDR family oxidoreductase [Thaumarchaeota archaeon]|nr:SDR family oxidoreductase [Nitrososphaerota archaeon]